MDDLFHRAVQFLSDLLLRVGHGVTEIFSYLLLGVVQGVTEIFPISSTAHLAIMGKLLEDMFGHPSLSLDLVVFLHLGTLFAIIVYYRKEVLWIARSMMPPAASRLFWRSQTQPTPPPGMDHQTPLLILMALAVTAVTALLLKPWVERLFGDLPSISLLMVANAIVLIGGAHAKQEVKNLDELSVKDYLLVGLAQGIAVLPGISRLGITLCAGLARGLCWSEALKLSFLLSIPTVFGATVLQLGEHFVNGSGFENLHIAGMISGIAAAAFTGYLTISLMLRESMDRRNKLLYFAYYCLLAGVFFFFFINFLG